MHTIDKESLPKHVAIIMDGNGRWAQSRGRARLFGHRSALEAVRDTIEGGAEVGLQFITLYAFSRENWNRPRFEVNGLMELLISTIHKEVKTLNENNIRLLAIGDFNDLPKKGQRELKAAIESTSGNTHMTLVLALSYSARWEIIEATKKIAQSVKNGELELDKIDEDTFGEYLATNSIPDPELMIRTSGEYRISNFLLWQMAYSELVFLDKFWPDFRREDLYRCIFEYQKRERRFGKTSEQVRS